MAKVVFCQRVVYAYFGIMAISAVLKKHGHSVELIMDDGVERVVSEILSIKPDVLAFSTLVATGEFDWALKIAKKVKTKKPNCIVVFGSMHPTLFPEETMQNACIDALCRGEGEYALLEMCACTDSGKSFEDVEGLWVRITGGVKRNPVRRPLEPLDELPFPDRELYQKYGYFNNIRSIDVLAGRACPYNCSYCYNHVTKEIYPPGSKVVRRYGVDYVIGELEGLKKKYKPRSFTFVDELFSTEKDWLKDFAKKYKNKIGLPFICNVRADTADEESIEILASAGVARVCLGLETGNEALRRELLAKPITNTQFIELADRLHRHGIKFLTANMLGLPGETIENAFETAELNYRMKTDYLYFSIFQPYPMLKITRDAAAKGMVHHLELSEYYSTYFRSSLLRQANIKQLVNLHKLFYPAVKLYRMKGLFRILIKLPANFIFDLVFILSFGWMQISCFKRDPRQLFAMGLGNLKIFNSVRKC